MSFFGHAEEIENTLNQLIAQDEAAKTKISVEITGDTADMLIELGKVFGWDVTTVLSYLMDQTRQLAERGLAMPEAIDLLEAEAIRASFPERDVKAGVWVKLKPGDQVLDAYDNIVAVIRLYSDGCVPVVDVSEAWSREASGDVWADDEDIQTYEQDGVVPLTAEETVRWANLTVNGEDYDTVLAEIRAAHGVAN